MTLKFYTSVAKSLKLKAREFWELIPTFVEATGIKLVGGLFAPPILNGVKFFKNISFIKKNVMYQKTKVAKKI